MSPLLEPGQYRFGCACEFVCLDEADLSNDVQSKAQGLQWGKFVFDVILEPTVSDSCQGSEPVGSY